MIPTVEEKSSSSGRMRLRNNSLADVPADVLPVRADVVAVPDAVAAPDDEVGKSVFCYFWARRLRWGICFLE